MITVQWLVHLRKLTKDFLNKTLQGLMGLRHMRIRSFYIHLCSLKDDAIAKHLHSQVLVEVGVCSAYILCAARFWDVRGAI